MSDLAEFLLARIAEDEAVVRAAVGSTVGARLSWNRVDVWSADRALAECEAKRRIIERAEFVANHGPAVDHVRALDMTTGALGAFRDVLGWLAQPYHAHPDYRAKWAPDPA